MFREVNERVRETIGAFGGPIDFLLFVVATGHEMVEVDRVVDQGNGYVLVEKIVAVDEVVAADPRSRGG